MQESVDKSRAISQLQVQERDTVAAQNWLRRAALRPILRAACVVFLRAQFLSYKSHALQAAACQLLLSAAIACEARAARTLRRHLAQKKVEVYMGAFTGVWEQARTCRILSPCGFIFSSRHSLAVAFARARVASRPFLCNIA